MAVSIRILETIPISGTIREVHFDARGDCTWIEFQDGEGQWAGVFGRGAFPDINLTAQFWGTTSAFVVAGGQGYIVDMSNRTCTHKTDCSYFQGLMSVPNHGLVVACDFTELEVFDSQRSLGRSGRIATDGIRLDRIDNMLLRGHIWEPEGWYAFEFDIERMRFERTGFVSAKWDYFD